jgi:hypothetical protein
MEAKGDCEHLPTCPIFSQFTMKGLKNVWISLYCKGSKQPQCVRKQLIAEGQEVPETLLPSGRHLTVAQPKPKKPDRTGINRDRTNIIKPGPQISAGNPPG